MQMPILTVIDVRLGAVTLAPPGEPPLVLTHDGVIYKGERIEDAGRVYHLLYETLTAINAREQNLWRTMAKDAQRYSWVAHHATPATLRAEMNLPVEGTTPGWAIHQLAEHFDETCDDFDDWVDGQVQLAGWRAPA